MNCVIVVPEKSGTLLVRIVVVLEFARLCHIFRPAVECRSGVRSVQVDGVWDCSIVDESNDRLCSTGYHESRAWRHPVVSDQVCKTQVGVDRLGKRLDLHFVVLDVLSRNWIGQNPWISPMSVCCSRAFRKHIQGTYLVGCLIGGIGRATL